MAKRSALIAGMAAALREPERSINVLAIELGKAGLIRASGRGLNAAEMTVTDASNLLISALSGGYATETAATTALVRSAGLIGGKDRDGKTTHKPPSAEAFAHLGLDHCFHEMLAAILGSFERHGGIEVNEDTQLINNVSVAITRNAIRYFCKVSFDFSDGAAWWLTYVRWKPFMEAADRRDWQNLAEEARDREGGKSTTEAVGRFVLHRIADCIRGSPMNTRPEP
ncbi:hypothetical protein [Methylobacterium sp. J-076]|uniref:hypothetical protein n=1 Tax=Methylobacterium sp. J-076 TaxID=2836655 RepID=UPI001FBC08C5|nr:hypothetical protein [Methylobacterium sp. J-076]MCJ2014983.1 hypothetical protein [Methylobacterium sp. J-076]